MTQPFRIMDGAEVWALGATHGLPMEVYFIAMAERHAVPDWASFYAAAMHDGTNLDRLTLRVAAAVRDSYDRNDAEYICERLPLVARLVSA